MFYIVNVSPSTPTNTSIFLQTTNLAVKMSFEPALANNLAQALPIPEDAPDMKTTLPASDVMTTSDQNPLLFCVVTSEDKR
jgi:hypothetical protein